MKRTGAPTRTAAWLMIRRDRSVLDLRDGTGIMEHFNRISPDYVRLTRLMPGWVLHGVVIRSASQRSTVQALACSAAGLIAVARLWLSRK